LKRIFELLYQVLVESLAEDANWVKQSLLIDYQRAGQKSALDLGGPSLEIIPKKGKANKRQQQHL
jgi:hypothetical protein